MRRLFLFSVSCFLFSFAASASEVIPLNNDWQFVGGAYAGPVTIELPHTWNSDALGIGHDFVRGQGHYRKAIHVPASWRGRRIFVRFGAANSVCDLLVNGRHAGQHRGGYTAFAFEITDFLRYGGQNSLHAIVDNAARIDVLPTAGGLNAYGGLTRGVELVVASEVAIAPVAGIRVSSQKGAGDDFTLSARVELLASRERHVDLQLRLLDAQGKSVATKNQRIKTSDKAATIASITLPVAAPRRWDGLRDPYLHTLEVSLREDTTLYEQALVAVGFRDIEVDARRGFLLNGRLYPLRGAFIVGDRPLIGSATRPRHIAQDVAIAREMGLNFLITRLPLAPEFYAACDSAGIVVMSQLPLFGATTPGQHAYYDTPSLRQNGRDQLAAIIALQSSHPSIAIWSLFDGLSMRGDDPTPYIKELNALAKKEDPSRPTACVSNHDGAINLITDLVLWRHRFGWNEGQPADIGVWLEHLHRSWATLRSAVAYGAGGRIDQQAPVPLQRPDPASDFHPENWQLFLHEQYYARLRNDAALWAIVAGDLFDYGDISTPLGISDMGLVTFDRSERKAAFRFYQEAWK